MKHLKIISIVIILCFSTFGFYAIADSKRYPPEVEKVLLKTEKNRKELEKFLDYCKNTNDSLKWKAACFLVANMDAHYSENYKWLTPDNQPYAFDELSYSTFDQAQAVRDKLLAEKAMKAEYYTTNDIETVTADVLENQVRRAFQQWKQPWAKHLTFKQFSETLLPYRCVNEKFENWYPAYEKEFNFMKEKKMLNVWQATSLLNEYIFNHFVSSFTFENRIEPIAFLSPLQLLFRQQGPCQDNVNYISLAMKSQGIPCFIDYVPYHATSTGRHYWNATQTEDGKIIPFETDKNGIHPFRLKREPGKVFRIGYAKQPGNLPDSYPTEKIPNNHLKRQNLKDVTAEYWKVTNLDWNMEQNVSQKISFVCVLNGLGWRGVDWCTIQDKKLYFKNMSTGVVYLPAIFDGKKYIPVAYPQSVDSLGIKRILKPNLENRIKVIMREEEHYLIFRPGKKYIFYYWNNGWIKTSEMTAGDVPELEFENIPCNALYLMIPEYSKGKERPFTINNEGTRIWW